MRTAARMRLAVTVGLPCVAGWALGSSQTRHNPACQDPVTASHGRGVGQPFHGARSPPRPLLPVPGDRPLPPDMLGRDMRHAYHAGSVADLEATDAPPA